MMTSIIVADVARGLPVDARAALRRSLASSWRWSGLIVILVIMQAGVGLLVGALLLAFNSRALENQALFTPSPWLLRWSPYGLVQQIAGYLAEAGLAYIAFAPLALVLDSAGAGSALAVSWRRVRGNWLRVCGGAILLWIPYGVLKVASRYLPSSPPVTWTTVVLGDIAWAFLLVGAALMYVRLIQSGSGAPPASDLVEPPFLNPEAAPS
jgi:hypothetical protein